MDRRSVEVVVTELKQERRCEKERIGTNELVLFFFFAGCLFLGITMLNCLSSPSRGETERFLCRWRRAGRTSTRW